MNCSLLAALSTLSLFSPLAFASPQFPILGNELQPGAGGTDLVVLSNPSAPGDAHYKCVPASRLRSATGMLSLNSIEGLFFAAADWTTAGQVPVDVHIDTASAQVALDPLVPDMFSTGTPALGLLSLGSLGLPNPCTLAPTLPGCPTCPPIGTGYEISISLSVPIVVPAPAAPTDTQGITLVVPQPDGLTYQPTGMGGGSCGFGDYVFLGMFSSAENQADYLNVPGASWGTGTVLAGGAPTPAATSVMASIHFGVVESVIEAEVSDPSVPFGPVRGGASLGVDASSGSVQLAARVTAPPALAGNACFPALSLTPLSTGVSVIGASLLIAPSGLLNTTLASWAGTGALQPVDENGDGISDQSEAVSTALTFPPVGGVRVHMQAFIVTGFNPITATQTTSWALDCL